MAPGSSAESASRVSCMPCTSTRSLTLTEWASAAGHGSLSRPRVPRGLCSPAMRRRVRLGCWARRASLPACSPFQAAAAGRARQAVRQAHLRAHRGRALLRGLGGHARPDLRRRPARRERDAARQARRGTFRSIIQLHGWAGSKSGLGSSKEWAEDGYAVLNYTRARLRRLLRVGGLAHGRPDRLRPRLGAPGRLALRGARHPVPGRPARRPGHRGPAPDRRDRRLLRRRPVADARHAARQGAAAQREVRAMAQPEGQAHGDRRRGAADPVVGPRGTRSRRTAARSTPRSPARPTTCRRSGS